MGTIHLRYVFPKRCMITCFVVWIINPLKNDGKKPRGRHEYTPDQSGWSWTCRHGGTGHPKWWFWIREMSQCLKKSSLGIIGFSQIFSQFIAVFLLKLASLFQFVFCVFHSFCPFCIWHDLSFTKYTLSCFNLFLLLFDLFCFVSGLRFTRDSRFNCLNELSISVLPVTRDSCCSIQFSIFVIIMSCNRDTDTPWYT